MAAQRNTRHRARAQNRGGRRNSWLGRRRVCSNFCMDDDAELLARYEIHAATRAHHASLCELARHLDTVNLPNDPAALEAILLHSERSFAGEIQNPLRREYVFVLWDRQARRAAGTSMVIAQLGRRDAPYIYFDVRHEEKYSATLDRHFVHRILATCYSYDGPTEIGGLVVHPDYRRRRERLGTIISYVRFLFIAMRRADMRDEVLAELLPPLQPDGTSHLWEAIGRRFTGLTYREADRLSKRNKEFIKGLFPDQIYATLLSDEAQRAIGEVGADTRGVEKLLRRIGFRYAERVDPFDGGPHFLAPTDEITLVRRAAEAEVEVSAAAGPEDAAFGLAARQTQSAPYFVATVAEHTSGGRVVVRPEAASALGVGAGDRVWGLPLR
jgi:arginine N-succinyltransferase